MRAQMSVSSQRILCAHRRFDATLDLSALPIRIPLASHHCQASLLGTSKRCKVQRRRPALLRQSLCRGTAWHSVSRLCLRAGYLIFVGWLHHLAYSNQSCIPTVFVPAANPHVVHQLLQLILRHWLTACLRPEPWPMQVTLPSCSTFSVTCRR